jgi:hypothetical protein
MPPLQPAPPISVVVRTGLHGQFGEDTPGSDAKPSKMRDDWTHSDDVRPLIHLSDSLRNIAQVHATRRSQT